MRRRTPLVYLLLALASAVPIVSAQSNDSKLLLAQGKQWFAQRNYQAANQTLTTYVLHFPTDPNGYFWLGKVAENEGSWQKAINFYAKSLMLAKRLGMDSEELRVNLGNAVLRQNYLDEAIFDYQRAIEINDKNILAHFNLSKAFLLKGQYEKSLQELSSCSQLGLIDSSLSLWRAIALRGLGRLNESQKEAREYCENESDQNLPELRELARQLAGQ